MTAVQPPLVSRVFTKPLHAIQCTADDHVKIACKVGASKGDNIYTKMLRKFIWLVYVVFKNSVLVFICKLANQRRQRSLPIHRFYSHIQVRKSRKEYCCAPLVQPDFLLKCKRIYYFSINTKALIPSKQTNKLTL